MRRSRIVAGVGIVLLAVACHSTDGPSDPFLGHWVGSDANMTLDLTVTGKASSLGGSGEASGPGITGGSIPFTLSGSDDGITCHVVMNSNGFASVNLTGSLGKDSIYATLDGGGFTTYGIDLLRQK